MIYHREKSDFGAVMELILMTMLGVLTIGVSVVVVFWLLEGVLQFFSLSIKGIRSA